MPELARFFGIIVRMFAEAAAPHHRPHFHAYYQDEVGIFAIDVIELIGGSLPQRQRRLAEAWAELHQRRVDSLPGSSCKLAARQAGSSRSVGGGSHVAPRPPRGGIRDHCAMSNPHRVRGRARSRRRLLRQSSKVSSTGRCATRTSSTPSRSTARFTPLCGPTAPTSIRQRFTIGPNTKLAWSPSLSGGPHPPTPARGPPIDSQELELDARHSLLTAGVTLGRHEQDRERGSLHHDPAPLHRRRHRRFSRRRVHAQNRRRGP